MPTQDLVLCPVCGGMGPRTALVVSGTDAACPVCAEVIVDAG